MRDFIVNGKGVGIQGKVCEDLFTYHTISYRKKSTQCMYNIQHTRVSVKAGTPPGTPGTYPEHPEPHPEHPEPYPEHPEPHPEHPEPYPEHPEPHPEHPEPHLEHAGIRAMKQRTCFSINSRVSH